MNFNLNNKIVAFSILSIICCNLFAQKKITLHFPNNTHQKKITIRYSINGRTNYMYEPYIDVYNTNSDSITISLRDSAQSYLMYIDAGESLNWPKNTIFLAHNRGSLSVKVDTINEPKFSGDHAEIIQLISNLKRGTGLERSDRTLEEYFSSPLSLFDFIVMKINTKLKLLDSIDTDLLTHKYTEGIIIDDYLYRIGNWGTNLARPFLQKADSISSYTDIANLFAKYNSLYKFGISLGSKATLKAMKLIPNQELDLGFDYNNSFYQCKYLNKDEQEVELAGLIFFHAGAGTLKKDMLNTFLTKYQEVFPNSQFTPLIKQIQVSEGKEFEFLHYSQERGFNELGRVNVDHLKDVIKMFVNSDYILLDFWATWCAPCLREFKYKKKIDSTLTKYGVETLYISLDFGGAHSSWKETIKENQLEGFTI